VDYPELKLEFERYGRQMPDDLLPKETRR
jgi:hypothetical protein